MIQSATLEELGAKLSKAADKARKALPAAELVTFGLYRIASSKVGRWYEVRAGRNEQGEYFIACQCRGALEGKACYHAARVFELHRAWTLLKSTPKAAKGRHEDEGAPYLKNTEEKPAERIGNIRI